MGQQQLLLLVLSIVLVGVAVVIGITVFADKSNDSDFDAISSEAVKIAAHMVSWKMSPSSLGGGSGAEYLTGLTFDAMGYKSTTDNRTTANSAMFMRSIDNLDSARPYIVVRPENNRDLRVQLFLYGTGPRCLKLRRAIRVDTEWQEADLDIRAQAIPDGCSGW